MIASVGHLTRRELRELLRAPWVYGLAGAILLLIGLSALIGLPAGAPSSTQVARYTAGAFSTYRLALFCIAVVVVPFFAAHTVITDLRSDTAPHLRLSPLSPVELLLGKLFAVLGLFAALCAATLPVAGMIFFFSGVDVAELAWLLARLCPLALCTAVIGLSQGCERANAPTAAAFASGYLILLGIYPLIAAYIVLIVLKVNELASVFFSAAFLFGPTSAPVSHVPGVAPLYLGLCSALQFWRATIRFRGAVCKDPETALPEPRWILLRSDAMVRVSWRFTVPDGMNPVRMRERWTHYLLSLRFRFFLGTFGFAWGWVVVLPMFVHASMNVLPGLGAGLARGWPVLLAVPPLAALSIVRERDQHALEHLLTSLLTPREILWGKCGTFMGALLPGLVGLFGSVLFIAAMFTEYFGSSIVMVAAMQYLVWLPAYLALIVCGGTVGALLSRGALNAIVMGYGVAALATLLQGAITGVVLRSPFQFLHGRWGGAGTAFAWGIDAAACGLLAAGMFALAMRLLPRSATVAID